MKVILLIPLLLLTLALSNPENSSCLYEQNGNLIADSTLKISSDQLVKWEAIESGLLKHIADEFVYPPMALENNIQGKSISQITIDSNGRILKFQSPKYLGWGIESSLEKVLNKSMLIKSLATNESESNYYLSLEFSINGDSKTSAEGYFTINSIYIPEPAQY